MESSRIFVRGLPPSAKETELKKLFAAQFPVTDAKFFPDRRIGYVGYTTPEEAAKAVKYFNRSFIRMSRISVELARPVDDMRVEKRRQTHFEEELLPKREKVQSSAPAPVHDLKFKAFLDTMKGTSKGKTWANEDFGAEQSSAVPTTVVDESVEGDSDAEYQHINKKRKIALDETSDFEGFDNEPEMESKAASAVESTREDVAEVDDMVVDDDNGEQNDKTSSQAPGPTSDADWARSRTNRVLDFMTDEDLEAKLTPKPAAHSVPSTTAQVNQTARQPEPDLTEAEDAPSLDEKPPATPPDETPSNANPRLFIRNLPYKALEQDLLPHFTPYGPVSEIDVVKDNKSGSSKGLAHVLFDDSAHAENARLALDGKPFQGRLLHIMPAEPKREKALDDVELSKLPLKVQKAIKRKADAPTDTFNEKSMYMSADAVVASAAMRLGVSKSDILDPTSSDAAVKQAQAEANTIQETKRHLEKSGVDVSAFNVAKGGGRSDTAMVIKNFPFGTTATELRDAFAKHGPIKRLIVPPAGTMAIIEMEQPAHAGVAWKSLRYSKFKNTILYVDMAPKKVFKDGAPTLAQSGLADKADVEIATKDALREFDSVEAGATSTLFVRNLNFSTTTEELRDLFRSLEGFLSAKVKTRTDSKRPGQILSMGFGFVEFRSKTHAQEALAAMNGYRLAGHELIIRASHKAVDAAEERRREDREKKLASQSTKIIIKNLPFEATKKDVRALFSDYGKLRSVRLPKKFDSSSRGFAFADFETPKEALNAMEALRDVHFLGRRLVLTFAQADTVDPEEEIQRMQAKVERQANKVAAQELTTGGRTKFRAHGGEEGDDE